MKTDHHKLLQEVTNWPHEIVGVIEIFHISDPVDDDIEGSLPSWISGWLLVDGRDDGPTVGIDGKLLIESNIDFDDIDEGKSMKVSLVYKDDDYSTEYVAGKEYREYSYTVIKIEQVK